MSEIRLSRFVNLVVAGTLLVGCSGPLTSKSGDEKENHHISVKACLDGITNNKPDNKCDTTGDLPLGIDFSVKNIFGDTLTSSQTDPLTGEAELDVEIPSGNSLFLSHRKTLLVQSPGSHGSIFVCAKPSFEETEKNKEAVTLPFSPNNCAPLKPKGPTA